MYKHVYIQLGLPWWLSSKESTCNIGDAGDSGSIPELERCPREGNGNPGQYSCLGNAMDRGNWQTQGPSEWGALCKCVYPMSIKSALDPKLSIELGSWEIIGQFR